MPMFPVSKRTAHILKASIAQTQLLRILTDKYITAAGTRVERIVATFGDDTFTVTIRKVEIPIPDEVELDFADYFSVEARFTRQGGEMCELTTEFLTAAAILSTTNFGAATNSTVAYTAGNIATISLIPDIIASIRRVRAKGEIADTVIISGPVYERIRQATLVQNFVRGTLAAGSETNETTIQQALAGFGIKQVLIGDSYYNSAADGATPSLTQIWGNTYIWVGKSGATPLVQDDVQEDMGDIRGVGANIFWEDYTPDDGYFVDTYREEQNGGQNIVRVKCSVAPYVGNGNAGDLIATQYS